MDIYSFAIQMETDRENLYRRLVDSAVDPGMIRILNGLADDEAKHREIVTRMRDQDSSSMAQTSILVLAKNAFEGMQGRELDLGGSQIELYQQAQELERQSQTFYLEAADQVSDTAQQSLLRRLADEEARHYFLLDHIIEFLARPLTWIEDAEFNHLDDY
jgi:rubrerythrin